MNPEQIDSVFALTLIGEYDDEAAWDAVRKLQLAGSREVCDRAAEWCRSNDPLKRARGADILAQLGRTVEHPRNNFPEECFSSVSVLVQQETNEVPLASAVQALGHMGNPAAISLILEHRRHSSNEVRFAVACALGSFAEDSRVVDTLLELMRDTDEDVRDWATFGLGVLGNLNSEEIRDAFWQTIHDSNRDVREEALVALSKRKDRRVLPVLIAELSQPEITDRVTEAAEAFLSEEEQATERSPVDYIAALKKRL